MVMYRKIIIQGGIEIDRFLLFNDIWAKTNPQKSLIEHMLDVGSVAHILLTDSCILPASDFIAKKLGITKEQAIRICSYTAALHDIGKCHPLFQQMDEQIATMIKISKIEQTNPLNKRFRHELYSEKVLKRILPLRGINRKTTTYISKIVSLHHQGKLGDGENINKNIILQWERLQDDIVCEIEKYISIDALDLSGCKHLDSVCILIWGIVVLSDWLASGELYGQAGQYENNLDYYKWALSQAKNAVDDAGLGSSAFLNHTLGFTDVFPNFSADSLRPIQLACQSILNADGNIGLMLIEAPMGEGKTEAALFSASRMGGSKKGIYVALPTSATSNQMYGRVNELFTVHRIKNARLLHATAWMLDEKSPDKSPNTEDADIVRQWLAPLRRGMLSPNAVGTIDQAMLSVMNVKYGVLRLLGLSGKVLIIDEVHAYDAYMSRIIECLLKWCAALEVPVLLLSATLPLNKRQALLNAYTGGKHTLKRNEYPLLTTASQGNIKEIPVNGCAIRRTVILQQEYKLGDWDAVAELAIEAVNDGGCLCIIVNTVKEAQKLYSILRISCTNDIWLKLFHAQFLQGRRSKIEHECLCAFSKKGKRPERSILVATQVVEQSLDLDFDRMFTAVAPIDLLLQRLGRLHRHDGRIRPGPMHEPIFTVLLPEHDYGPTEAVYAPWILDKTVECLTGVKQICIPEDIRPLVGRVYDNSAPNFDDEKELKKWADNIFVQQLQASKANRVMLAEPDPDYFCMLEDCSLTLSEDDDAKGPLIASTRLGEPTTRVAFIDKELFTPFLHEGGTDKKHAKYAMEHSVSIRTKYVSLDPQSGFDPPIVGTGFLKGMLLYPTQDNRYCVNDKIVSGYVVDDNLGIIIERM